MSHLRAVTAETAAETATDAVGIHEPLYVDVEIGEPDYRNVYVTLNFENGASYRFALGADYANSVANHLKAAHAKSGKRMEVEAEQEAAEMAAFCATLCPVHDGCTTEAERCTCTGRCARCGQHFTEADAATDSITDTCSDCLRSA